jgi:flagellar basal-body rod protein FlgC
MDYRAAFQISAAGMTVEKARLDVTSVNLANMHTTRGADGSLFQPLRVVAQQGASAFAQTYGAMVLAGPSITGVEEAPVDPRMVYEPGNPQADDSGFVAYPGVDQVAEMVNLVTAVRAYEANVVAMNATRTMAAKALDIGGNT